MTAPVDTRITPALDPETYRSVKGYNDQSRGYVDDVIGAVNDIYVTLGRVHNAKELWERNPASTPEQRVLIVGAEAKKHKERVSQRLDRACADLAGRIAHVEAELKAPLVQQAVLGSLNVEVRAYVKGLTRPEREKLLTEALDADDAPTLHAVLGAQPFLSGMTQVDHQWWTQRYHEKKNPHLVERLALMKRVDELVGRNSHLLHAAFEKAVGGSPQQVREIQAANARAVEALKIEPTL